MRTGKLFLGAAGVLAILLGGLGRDLIAQQQTRAGAIRVVLQPSGVARQRGNQVVRSTAEKDMAVFFQDVLETGVGGRMRARLDDGSILALGSQSRLTVQEHNTATEQTTLQLQYGKVRAQVVEKTRPDAKFEVQTNTAVAGVLGTDFVTDAFSPVNTSVLCIEGQIEVRNADAGVVGTVILNEGEITFVQQGVVPTPPRPATPQEIQEALEGSGGAAPEAIADIGTGFVTAGDDLVLSGRDSFVTGTIISYQWTITREANSQVVFNQSQADPDLILDTTTLEPGNYLGTLTITTSNNETATTSFGFVVLPSAISNTNPELVIQQLQLAYETLQPNEFMKLFDPVKYSGYAALQQSVEASFRNLSQARVFVRRASGQMFEQDHVAIYQVDFEIQFSTKAEPDKTYVTREQATLRLESGSGWLIADVPQGQLGGGGLLAIPGVGNPDEGNTVPDTGNAGTSVPNIIPQGGEVVVLAGGSNTFEIQNTSSVPVTITFSPPPGITVTGSGVAGTTFTIPPGGTLVVVFSAGLNQPAGTVEVITSITSGNSTLPGPTIPVIVAQLTLSFPGAGGSAGNPVPVLLGFEQTASVQVDSTVQTGHTVALSGSGGQVGTSFAPNPLVIAAGSSSGTSTITLTPSAEATPGSDAVAITGSSQALSFGGTLFIDRIAPFTLTRTSPDNVVVFAGQTGTVTFDVSFNAPFAGPVTIQAPAIEGVTISPGSVTLNSPGTATFTLTAGPSAVGPTGLEFAAATGAFEITSEATVTVVPPPAISSFSPTDGLVGAIVTITGTNFTGATDATFNGVPANFSVVSDTQITATVPSGAATGPISVTTPAGTGTSSTAFTVLVPAPEISSFSPASGLVGAGVTIAGTNFTGATDVTFNGVAANFNVVSDTQITATVPSGATTGPIGVTTPGGTGSSSAAFTVQTAPAISSFSPTDGLVGAGVTISGTNFTGATDVTFNGVAANFNVVSDTQITATVPSGATTGPIGVTTPAGTAASGTPFTVLVPAPAISSFLPTSGLVGQVVTISGSDFTGATAVTFGGIAASFSINSDAQITATVPVGAITGPITVTGPGGTGSSSANFTVILPPSFSLCVSDGQGPCLTNGDFVDVNSTIPVGMQVSVLPQPGFNSPVTVTVPDSTQITFSSFCGLPAGGTYASGVLSFTLTSPYTSPASFCMSAGVPTIPSSDSGVTFTGTPSGGGVPDSVTPTFRIGVPDLTITPPTFIVPAALLSAALVPGVATVDIALASPSGANVFNLPLTVFVTGVGSSLSGTGPFLAPLPAGIDSPDCGPPTSGLSLSPGGLVTCTIRNSNLAPFNSSGTLEVFVTFGPGGGGSVPLGACGAARGVRANCAGGAQSMRSSSGYGTQGTGGAVSDGKSGLTIAPESVQFTPLAPKPGDRVSIQARVENNTGADAEGIKVGLVLNGTPAASLAVSIPAGGSQPVEFLWEAEYYQRLQFEITLQGTDGTAQTVPVRNLFVEPEMAGTFNQGRSELAIINGECGGFRFVLGTQTFCGGSSDLELSPVITGDGQLLVQAFSLNGGIIDLGPQPITGQLTVPEAGYAAKGWLEPGRLYAVESQGKYGLLYVSRVQSDIDPRLARLTRGTTEVDSLDGMLSDRLDDLLDRSRVTVVVEWAYLENGSRRFSYGFSGIERGGRPNVIRQPRVPATPQRQ